MQAVEFKTKPHNGIIKLPSQFQQWDDRQIRVILLIEEMGSTIQTQRYAFDAVSLNTKGFRFNREEANER